MTCTFFPGIEPATTNLPSGVTYVLWMPPSVWTMRTVAAPRARLPASENARIRESLVFIASHFKLPGHVVDLLFCPVLPAGPRARLRRVQSDGPAAPDRKAAGPRSLHHVPLD